VLAGLLYRSRMKILSIADIHFKLGQKNVPKEWASKRYEIFLEQLYRAEQEVDLVVIPGDIFDRSPTIEELDLYFQFIYERSKPTIISTGNHEATKKGKSFFSKLKEVTERLNPNVKVVVDYIYSTDDFHVVPYEFIGKKDTWDNLSVLPVFTHVRGEIPPHVKPEIPLEWLDKFPIVIAGDLHSHSNTQRNIVYPGSPMTTSFHRHEVDTGYLIIDSSDWSWKWHKFSLPQLIRKTVADPEDMVPTEYHHTIYELEGNLKDLSGIANTELLDKKLVKRNSDTALVLSAKMTLSEKLSEYLLYILELKDKEVEEVMGVFNEYRSSQTN
jgi:DNA repair exonuclease SbcCD nuclease subunit